MATNTIAIRVGWYGDAELEFRRMAELGFGNIECPLPSPDKVADLLSRLKRNDLKATTLTVACPIHDDSVFDQMKTAVDIALQTGVDRFFASVHSHGLPWDTLCERLRQVGDILAEGNILLGMETHEDLCQNADVAIHTFESVKHPHIRMNFDTANIYYYNKTVNTTEDGIKQARQVASYVSSVHLKDTNGGFADAAFPVVGEGIVDFTEIFYTLNSAGFYGPFTFEMEGFDLAEIGITGLEDRISRSMMHLKQLGLI